MTIHPPPPPPPSLLPPPQELQTLIQQGSHPTLTPEVCKGLLQEAPESSEHRLDARERVDGTAISGGLEVLTGYPDNPLYHRLANSLAYWMVTG